MMRRRTFLGTWVGLTAAALSRTSRAAQGARPNILWITCEDMSPSLGCYGDAYAKTPVLDAFAQEAVRYTQAFATAPVCAPARSCIITGVHAISLGTEHLRSLVPLPEHIHCYTEYLRAAGYYCTNNVKEDYQFTTPNAAWDESSNTAHWKNRTPGQPFFAIFNTMLTHQSQTRYVGAELEGANAALPAELRHSPKEAPLPPYYPDTPTVRENVTAYYTQITRMDQDTGEKLRELEEAGLGEDTIVFFYSDHGAGLPRGKRWLHVSGTKVPLMIRFPKKYAHLAPAPPGSTVDRLVCFADLAPTMLSLLGLDIPDYLQGRPFLGPKTTAPQDYVFATRDRVDEVIPCSRMVFDGRYQYIKNFLPHRPRMPRSWYSEQTQIRQEVRRLAKLGELAGDAAYLAAGSIPAEELYDTATDPHEMHNLAGKAEHADLQMKLSSELRRWMIERLDTGMVPESLLLARCDGRPPYAVMRTPGEFDFVAILAMAERVGMGVQHRDAFLTGLRDAEPAIRFWAATGLAALGPDAAPAKEALMALLTDGNPAVRTAVAEALCVCGAEALGLPVLVDIVAKERLEAQLEAAYALNNLAWRTNEPSAALKEALRQVTQREEDKEVPYLNWAVTHMVEYLVS